MRIGLITGEYPPDQGGVGDFTARLAHALTGLGHRVHVIASKPRSVAPQQEVPGSRIHPEGVTVHRVMGRWGLGCWSHLSRLSRELDLDILNVQYQAAAYDMRPGVNLVPRRPPIPTTVTFHDLKVPYLFPKAGPLREWVVRSLARRAHGVIVTNREDELVLQEPGAGVSTLTRIPIGSNISTVLPQGYDRDAERARWGVHGDDLLLGYFGFLNESKGGETLIRTLQLLVDDGLPAHLLKIGGRTGSSDPTNRAYADTVERLVSELELRDRVHFTGYVPPEQVSASLYAADVCVLPYRDGVSFRRGSLIACLAHGRPIVTTRPAVPLPELEEGQNVCLVDPENPAATARAVRAIAENPVIRSRLERGAQALAAGFAWDRIAERTAAFFSSLIGRGR